MKRLILSLMLFMIIKILNSQEYFSCDTPENFNTLKSATCNNWNNYEAVDPFNTPIKYVQVTFHIMQKSDGTGNFPNNSSSINWLSGTLINSINDRMGGLQAMALPTSSPTITDSRVRFSLANIYFWQDDYGWAYQLSYNFQNYLMTNFVQNQPNVQNKSNSIHIFMCENDNGRGYASGIGDKSNIIMAGIYARYLVNDTHGATSGLAHELGHSIGLNHTWYGDECDDTPNNPNCWNVNEPAGCSPLSNNLMDYNVCKCALTMCQINRLHYFLLGGEGNITDCVISEISVQNPTIIGSDLICSSGATFTSSNRQLGVTSQWNASPTNFFQNTSGCGSTTNVMPVSSSIGGEGQINYTFDWQRYGTSTASKNVWVGKVNQLNLCSFDRNVYQADNIFSPGGSCQPMSAIIANGTSVKLIGGVVTLNEGFEVQLGGSLEIETTGGCQ